MRWVAVGDEVAVFAFGQDATGVFAFGQFATGVIAFGQLATGVIAIGQLARGVVAIGQLAFGVLAAGQLVFGVVWATGLLGLGATASPWMVYGFFGRTSPRRLLQWRSGKQTSWITHAPRTMGWHFVLSTAAVALLVVVWSLLVGMPLGDGLADVWIGLVDGVPLDDPSTLTPTSRPLH